LGSDAIAIVGEGDCGFLDPSNPNPVDKLSKNPGCAGADGSDGSDENNPPPLRFRRVGIIL
jgi:hypothetical protein